MQINESHHSLCRATLNILQPNLTILTILPPPTSSGATAFLHSSRIGGVLRACAGARQIADQNCHHIPAHPCTHTPSDTNNPLSDTNICTPSNVYNVRCLGSGLAAHVAFSLAVARSLTKRATNPRAPALARFPTLMWRGMQSSE